MSCPVIQLREITPTLPDWVKDSDGNVTLDVFEDFQICQTKSSGKLNDLDQIGDEDPIGDRLPRTLKNETIFKEYGCFNSTSDQFQGILVNIFDGGIPICQDTIQVIGKSDTEIEIDLVQGEDAWVNAAKRCKLCDIDLGTFVFTCENLLENWQQPIYGQGNTSGLYFPLINFGNWSKQATWTDFENTDDIVLTEGCAGISDFRPFIHLLSILEKGFKKIGYNFKSPVFETEWGRRIILYLLKSEGFGEAVVNNEERCLTEAINTDTQFFDEQEAQLDFNVANKNINNYLFLAQPQTTITSWSLLNSGNPSSPPIKVCHVLELGIEVLDSSNDLEIEIVLKDRLFGIDLETYNFVIPADNSNTIHPINIITEQIATSNTDFQWCIRSTLPTLNSGFLKKTVWRVLNKSDIFFEGDEIQINKLIDCEKTLFDLLKGARHLVSGLIQTNKETKTVCLFHPEKTDVFGETPEPFYKPDTYQEIETSCEDSLTSLKPLPDSRYIDLCFDNSSDNLIASKGLENVHGQEIDLIKALEDNTEEECNPCIEPTLDQESPDISGVPVPFVDVIPPTIPHMLDNDQHEISYDLGVRALIAWGYDCQINPDFGIPAEVNLNECFEELTGYQENYFPQASQCFKNQVGDPNNPTTIDFNLVYGNKDQDLYTMFWRSYLIDKYIAQKKVVNVFLTPLQYANLDFRECVFFSEEGKPITAKVDETGEHKNCENGTTELYIIQKMTCADVGF